MTKPKICLLGRHSHRTPLSYSLYKIQACNYFEYVSSPFAADIVVLGFSRDIRDNSFVLWQAKKSNPDLRVVVVSEEPLWISIWSEYVHEHPNQLLTDSETEIEYFQISCINSDIFASLPCPYFITTEGMYVNRYATKFRRNSTLNAQELWKQLRTSVYHYAFIGEYRDEDLDKRASMHPNVIGLSGFRTAMSKLVTQPKFIKGYGWSGSDERRQASIDWHLEKLASLDGRVRFVCAIENTSAKNYVTEKIFDALACQAIPVIWSDQISAECAEIAGKAGVNVCGLDPSDAALMINSSEIALHQSHAIIEQSGKLLEDVLDISSIIETRHKVISRIFEYFSSLP